MSPEETEPKTEGDKDPKDDKGDPEVTIHKKKTKIDIKIDREPEIDALQKELAEEKAKFKAEQDKWEAKEQKLIGEKKVTEEELTEKSAILEKAALEAFEAEKTNVLKLCEKLTDEQREEIEAMLDSPTKLGTVKNLVNMLLPKEDEGGEGDEGKGGEKPSTKPKKAPAGKPVFTPPKDAKEYEDARVMVDKLYKTAYSDPEATVEEKQEAEKKINALWSAFIHGKSWKSLRGGGRYPLGEVMACPKCGRIYFDSLPTQCENPECGANLSKVGKKV